MKKSFKKYLSIIACVLTVVLLAATLASCSTKLSGAEAFAALKEAVSESLKADVYFWEEYIKGAERDENGEVLLDKQGRELLQNDYNSVKILYNKNGARPIVDDNELAVYIRSEKQNANRTGRFLQYEAYCDFKISGARGDEPWLFERLSPAEGEALARTKTQISPREFVDGYIDHNGYALKDVLGEILYLTQDGALPAWAEIVEPSRFGRLTEMTIEIDRDSSLFQQYTQEVSGSILTYANRVQIEIVGDRVSKVICEYNQGEVFLGISAVAPLYELYITYFGSNIRKDIGRSENSGGWGGLPSYDDAVWEQVLAPAMPPLSK